MELHERGRRNDAVSGGEFRLLVHVYNLYVAPVSQLGIP
jgi:hypothetical protein